MDKLFDLYLNELLEWNQKFNLTAITDPAEIRVRHFQDSLSVLEALELKDQQVVDIGPGAGFPGIPLKIVRPGIKLTLVEATRKKVDFLNHLIKALELTDVAAVWGRAETVQKEKRYAGRFDVALARAVAKLPVLLEYSLPFLKPGGLFVAQKQAAVQAEIDAAQPVLKKLGGRLMDVKQTKVGGVPRSLIIFRRS
ncbi:MAG: 16S rRNA (guanine(527)-N(7))-methyltransferase RsmG [Candidatus Margulisbacteria bacterium]|nr:16S rRNA (guanine(527)-N(7))-methyltransferase RsmG [Candidatus Margulisiibacteriota bacterium]